MSHKILSRYVILFFVLMAAVALAACGSGKPTPKPELASEPQPTTIAVRQPALSPTPTEAPQPVIQRLDLPPIVVGTSPEQGQEHPLDAPIIVRFDQPMDPESTGMAFSIEPAVTGQVAVRGAQLVFTPSEPLRRGAAYQVSIEDSARSTAGKQLAAPAQFRFATVGFLQVTSTQPADGNEEVSVDTPITVIFNRPVVPLASVDAMEKLPAPLHIEPAVAGQGQWLNTSIYTFRPDEPLAGSTRYTVTVAAGLQDTRGALLAEDVVFSFQTASPIVESFEPRGNLVSPATAITVTFSQPMDRPTTEAAFSLRSSETDDLVEGTFTWSEDSRMLRFEPAGRLLHGIGYIAQVTTGARSASGQGKLREAYIARFQTAPRIRIVGTWPADGATNIPPEARLQINFEGLVDQATMGRKAFTITFASLTTGNTGIPEPTSVYSYYSHYDRRWNISWPLEPRTAYQVILSGDIGDIFGNTLGQEVLIRFTTGDRRPFARLNVPGEVGTYNAYTNTLIAASYRNVSRLDFTLHRVGEVEALRLLGPNRWETLRSYRPNPDALVRQWSVVVAAAPNATALDKIALQEESGPLPPGIYWLEMRAPEIQYSIDGAKNGQDLPRHLLIVSPLNLVVKKAVGEVLVWATDLQSGQPVADLPVRVDGAASARGATDSDGIFRAPISTDQPWQPLVVFAGQHPEGAAGVQSLPPYGVVSSDWQQGLSPWEFDLPAEFSPALWRSYFYTDRPLYRPGQTVYWKGILRADDDNAYSVPPPGTRLDVVVRDGQGNQVYQEVHQTNQFGTIHGELTLDEEAGLGYYYLEARMLDMGKDAPSFGFGFQVAEYRKPEFEVTVTTDRDEYLQGDTINATVQADFFFGGPVGDARVEWTVFSDDAFFSYTGDTGGRWYSFNDWSGWNSRPANRYGGEQTSGSGRTDAQGRLTFQIPADIAGKLQSQRFNIDVRVIDLNNQEVAASTAALVHKGLVYPGVAPRRYVGQVGTASQVDLIAVDWDSRPVANQELTVVVSKARWNVVQEKGDDGRFYWVARVEETPVLTRTLITDADGHAVLSWTPDAGGQVKIKATAVDSKGNVVRSAAFMWISAATDTYVSWRIENNDRIELVADKPLYQVGDTAQVLVPHPYQGEVQALVTVERGGILDVQRITLAGNSETLAIPIEAGYVPNVYVSVVIVKGQDTDSSDLGSFKLGNVQLPVDTSTRQLKVTLTPSQERLKPGETVTFTMQVNDHAGNPVQGEFSLALVDKALLSLAQGNEGTLVDAFYRQRGLGVQTASTLVLNVNRLNQQLREGAKGGGGGGGEAGLFVDVRSEFEDTALWEPAIVTDENGRAVVSVKLPDNLTTWRLDGRGVTVDTEIGQATVEIVTTLPLLVRPLLPRFFVTGDQAEIGAILNNNTEAERTLQVELAGSGWSGADDEQVAARQVTVPAGGQARVTWPVLIDSPPADQAVGQATIRFTAWELTPLSSREPLRDAVEMTLPVYRYTSPETVSTAGTVDLDEERLEVIALPPNVDPTQGELQVRLEPSLAAGITGSLAWLEHFPYECNEQIVSKFLPNVVTYRALADLGIEDPQMKANLQEQIGTALQKLLQRQNPDGGWGWWGGQDSRPFVSSFVVFGLVEAQKAGFGVDQAALQRATSYLSRQLKPVDQLSGYQLNQQAFMLYVLAEAGAGDTGRIVTLYDVRERLAHYGRAYLALALGVIEQQGESTARPRLAVLLDDLTGAAILSATGAHWEEESSDWWTMNTDTRSTAVALAALARFDPENGLAPNAVRWLMNTRQASRWQTTQENVWAIIALTDWTLAPARSAGVVATGELDADYSYQVTLNGQELASGTVDRSNVDQPIDLRVEVRDLLRDTASALAFSRFAASNQTGAGQLYYTAHLNYYLPVEELEARDRGVVVAREYRLIDPVSGQLKSEAPISSAQVGDTIQVKLTLVVPHNLHYLVLESPLPAGAEGIDPSLATTSQVYEGPQIERAGSEAQPWWWRWRPSHSEFRDEKVVLFADYLAAGTYEYTYLMRASLPGQFQTLPATAYEMYFPEVWGRSAGEMFEIGE